jgi:hypothetical protein
MITMTSHGTNPAFSKQSERRNHGVMQSFGYQSFHIRRQVTAWKTQQLTNLISVRQ